MPEWTKGHSGVNGNELRDRITKKETKYHL